MRAISLRKIKLVSKNKKPRTAAQSLKTKKEHFPSKKLMIIPMLRMSLLRKIYEKDWKSYGGINTQGQFRKSTDVFLSDKDGQRLTEIIVH